MFEILDKYKHNGEFTFNKFDSLSEKCNAPKNKSGVYIVLNENNELIYIGRSGEKLSDGTIKHRQGGIYDRIVNGKQFGRARKISWPLKMTEDGFLSLQVLWFDTENDNPEAVESLLIHEFLNESGSMPFWNGQLPRTDYNL